MKKKEIKQIATDPPNNFEGEELNEWSRIIKAITESGRTFADRDRSLLTMHCQLWALNQKCYGKIKTEGSIVTWPNGVIGPSVYQKEFQNTSKLLRGTLTDLGCTPASRDFDEKETKEKDDKGDLVI